MDTESMAWIMCPLEYAHSNQENLFTVYDIDHSPLYVLPWMSLTVSDLDDFVLLGGGPPDRDLEGRGRNHAAHWRPGGGKGECLQSGILPLHRDRGMAPNHSPIGDTPPPTPLSFLPHLHNYICQSHPSRKKKLSSYLFKQKENESNHRDEFAKYSLMKAVQLNFKFIMNVISYSL